MKKLHYQVNHYARGLKTNKTNCIALVMPSLQHPFLAALVDALTTSLMKAGYRAFLMITNFDSVTENHCFTLAQQNKIDGIIALSYSQDMEINDSVPIVTIDRHFTNNIPCVSSDNYQGGVMAAEKLIALGCENLLFLRIGSNVHGEVEKRGVCFEIACRMAGVRYQSLILEDGEQEEAFFASWRNIYRMRSWSLTAYSAIRTLWRFWCGISRKVEKFGFLRMCRSSAMMA